MASRTLICPGLNLHRSFGGDDGGGEREKRRRCGGGAQTCSAAASAEAAAAARPPAPEKKRHWKEGEHPGVSDGIVGDQRSPIKNVKKRADDRLNAKAWASTVTEALSDRIQKKQWQEALEVFEMLRRQPFYAPKEGTYVKLLVLLGRSGQPDRARELFDAMVEEGGCGPTTELYTALLSGYCRNNLLDEAFSVLAEMKNHPVCQPDVFTYSSLIKLCVDTSNFDRVDQLFEEMSERLIVPNTVTHNIILSGYGKAGFFDKMEEVLVKMLESTNCKPDVWTMNTIISLFGNKGQIDLMERWYEKFRGYGIEPETRTFNILIGAYGKQRRYDKMTAVMEYMRKLEFPWTTSTYNNVIEAFADVGDAKHMEVAFEQMRAERMRVDTKTVCCLINGYGNAGLFHKVVSTIQLAERSEVPKNASFYNAVISACAKAEDLMEMERVFKRMKDGGVLPNEQTFSIMVEAYKKEGMHDKVYDLELEKQMMGAESVDGLEESEEAA
ncbi:Pentatricopeptide repeat-containing protein [Acorus calamus]|uniref:Pentatricopeptide repeat-containing protein n=1 Tax=Acorus calamus TaxID=4465 RepID=A0AAV9CTL6_ACOCL|nr:Pentatricopeptide repeat-containing protein [Acorus calamus]